jgi:hypothetical protein
VIQREGEGWRLAWDASRHPFSVLIAGNGWAAELTDVEAAALRDGVGDLVEQYRQLIDQLMAEESIELELERGVWWLSIEGDRQSWSLRAVLSPDPNQRAVEAFWPAAAAGPFTLALQQLYGQP